MKGNAYSRILNTMQRQGSKDNEMPLTTGTVESIEPLTIMFNNVKATDSVICKMPHMDKKAIEAIENNGSIPDELKSYLTEFNKAFNLEPGDKVIVQKSGNTLYVLGKA